jgi:serine/threonine-protein kinase
VIELLKVLAPTGRLEEGRVAWEALLEANPPDFDSWNGYPQLCLYVGNEPAYRRVRRRMLDRFGNIPGDWMLAERTGVSCLLLPASGDEARRATAIADRSIAEWGIVLATKSSPKPENPYVLFVAGLSKYRQGRAKEALPLLQESVAKISDRASPRLVLAMAQFESGLREDSRKTLAEALRAYSWEPVADERLWVSDVLRREAEALILPDVPPLRVRGVETPANDERLALVEICHSKGLNRSAARLMAEAFAADADVADKLTALCRDVAGNVHERAGRINVLNSEPRYLAARSAALAGCGIGNDTADLRDEERARWRRQAREWLRDDLNAWGRVRDGDPESVREGAKEMLALWQSNPDLARLREPNAMKGFATEEREEWAALWKAVRDHAGALRSAN